LTQNKNNKSKKGAKLEEKIRTNPRDDEDDANATRLDLFLSFP
jgi:hypothetical protein